MEYIVKEQKTSW